MRCVNEGKRREMRGVEWVWMIPSNWILKNLCVTLTNRIMNWLRSEGNVRKKRIKRANTYLVWLMHVHVMMRCGNCWYIQMLRPISLSWCSLFNMRKMSFSLKSKQEELTLTLFKAVCDPTRLKGGGVPEWNDCFSYDCLKEGRKLINEANCARERHGLTLTLFNAAWLLPYMDDVMSDPVPPVCGFDTVWPFDCCPTPLLAYGVLL